MPEEDAIERGLLAVRDRISHFFDYFLFWIIRRMDLASSSSLMCTSAMRQKSLQKRKNPPLYRFALTDFAFGLAFRIVFFDERARKNRQSSFSHSCFSALGRPRLL